MCVLLKTPSLHCTRPISTGKSWSVIKSDCCCAYICSSVAQEEQSLSTGIDWMEPVWYLFMYVARVLNVTSLCNCAHRLGFQDDIKVASNGNVLRGFCFKVVHVFVGNMPLVCMPIVLQKMWKVVAFKYRYWCQCRYVAHFSSHQCFRWLWQPVFSALPNEASFFFFVHSCEFPCLVYRVMLL